MCIYFDQRTSSMHVLLSQSLIIRVWGCVQLFLDIVNVCTYVCIYLTPPARTGWTQGQFFKKWIKAG